MRDRINSCIRILRVHKGLTLLFTLCDSESRTGISVSGRCEQEASVCDESTDWASGRPEFRASQLLKRQSPHLYGNIGLEFWLYVRLS